MAAKTNHPCFTQPKDDSVPVWRYMDFTKFFSLISTRSLFLCRADLLGDPFEGSYSKANIKLRPEAYKNIPDTVRDNMLKQAVELHKWIPQWTYISCWHINVYESAAMWKLYTKSNEAVAIQTTYKNLTHSLPDEVFAGIVQYIDYEKDWLPEDNVFYAFMHKRKSFAHEQEVRIVHQNLPKTEKGIDFRKRNDREGISVKVDLTLLIGKVYTAPTSPSWYRDLIGEALRKCEITKAVYSSKLDEEPVY